MRKHLFISSLIISLFLVFSCADPTEEIRPEIQDELNCKPFLTKASKVTGFVQVEWKGKGGSGTVEDKLAYAVFSAQESVIRSSKQKFVPAKGSFIFSVYKSDFTPERKIVAKVVDVGFANQEDKKAWIFAEVISDSKCDSSDHSGCSDSDHEEGGGCSDGGSDTTHDEGCSHDDTGDTHVDTGTEGGCSHDDSDVTHDDTGTEGACSHDDTGTEHDEGSGGKPDDKGGKGKQCRVGQYVVVKMHDNGSPGTNDGITWKWFESLDGFSIESEPQKLCKKTILSGNLVVHVAKTNTIAYGK